MLKALLVDQTLSIFFVNVLLNSIKKKIQFNSVTCTFRASCYSTHLLWAYTPVISWVVCLGQMVSS